jgi:hypothetical protein
MGFEYTGSGLPVPGYGRPYRDLDFPISCTLELRRDRRRSHLQVSRKFE